MDIKSFYKRYGRNTTNNFQLKKYAKELKLPNFYVCMRDEIKHLPRNKLPLNVITNINSSQERGVHWSAFNIIDNKKVYFFDSFGLPPTKEILDFIPAGCARMRNTFEVQKFGQSNCGQLSLYVLYKLNNGEPFNDIIISLL